jgi:hypothetical protein
MPSNSLSLYRLFTSTAAASEGDWQRKVGRSILLIHAIGDDMHVATQVRITARGDSDRRNTELGRMLLASIARYNRAQKEKERRRRKERANA